MKAELQTTELNDLHCEPVVVHMKSGALIKGFLNCIVPQQVDATPGPLTDVLAIKPEQTGDASCAVRLADAKALFFVRTHEGNSEHEDFRFFTEEAATEVWVQFRLADGETLEGRIVNSVDLLLAPGVWLWPTDTIANNSLVYVPKTSVVEFRVMGLASVG